MCQCVFYYYGSKTSSVRPFMGLLLIINRNSSVTLTFKLVASNYPGAQVHMLTGLHPEGSMAEALTFEVMHGTSFGMQTDIQTHTKKGGGHKKKCTYKSVH